jgi:hypothetical protein
MTQLGMEHHRPTVPVPVTAPRYRTGPATVPAAIPTTVPTTVPTVGPADDRSEPVARAVGEDCETKGEAAVMSDDDYESGAQAAGEMSDDEHDTPLSGICDPNDADDTEGALGRERGHVTLLTPPLCFSGHQARFCVGRVHHRPGSNSASASKGDARNAPDTKRFGVGSVDRKLARTQPSATCAGKR